MTLDIVLLAVAVILMIAGLVGCVAPLLPGPPLCYVGLLAAHCTQRIEFSTNFLLLWAGVVIVVTILDHFIPIWGAKKFGGTSAGMWGAAVGLFVGAFVFPPIGLVLGTMLGAFAGELLVNSNDVGAALKSALGAFVGFVLSVGLKLSVSAVMTFYLAKEIIASFVS